MKWTQLLFEIIFKNALDSLRFTLILHLSFFLRCTIGTKCPFMLEISYLYYVITARNYIIFLHNINRQKCVKVK